MFGGAIILLELLEAKNRVDAALNSGNLAIVVGNCRVKYEGRAASKLSEGDRVLIIKGDGTFLVHQSTGMAAINYQGPGASVTSSIDGSELTIKASRHKKNSIKEEISVAFSTIAFADAFTMRDDRKLALFGSEKQLSGLLMQDLALIEKGLTPLRQESVLRRGTIDILAQDANGKLVVVEVKRRQAALASVSQLERYVAEVRKRKNVEVRGMICAPSITENALKMMESKGFEYFRLDYEIGNPSARIRGLQRKQKSLGDFQPAAP